MPPTARTILTTLVLLATAAALFITGGSSRNGCLWDSDTLRTEATGAPGMVETIVGRFDRYPPLYYEMRLERVAKELEADPSDHLDNLAAYDDAGVACDRLGKSGEAIAWMARKRAALDATPDSEAKTDHEYRYLANLGTFHAHRWISSGADRSDLTDIQRAHDLIDQAITLNPDAHFGRERYQLLALDWILQPPPIDPLSTSPSNILEADPALAGRGSGFILGELEGTAHADAGEGFAGLIALGNAWNSFDVFFSLGDALQGGGDSSIAALAWLRAEEIALNGGHSLHPHSNASGFRAAAFTNRHLSDPAPVEAFYQQARAEADAWHTARTAYITTRLEQGEHPDTHPDFFAAWVEPSSMPNMPNGVLGFQGSILAWLQLALIALIVLGTPVALVLALAIWVRRRRKRRRTACRCNHSRPHPRNRPRVAFHPEAGRDGSTRPPPLHPPHPPLALRRVLPLWLVLASLFIGLLATAASVVEASYRFAWWNTVLGFRPVAWSAEIHYGDRHGDRIESVRCYAERGMERWHWRPGPFDPDPRDLTPELADQVWGGPMPVYIGPEDDPRPAMARVPDPGYESNPSYLRAGWPFFAAQGREIYGFPTGTSVGRTHEVIGLTTVRIYGRYVEIPFRPIWPGLLGNTLFYAVPAALVLSAVRVVVLGIRHALRSARARRRAKRGRCPACGYELGEGVTICPECGRAMAKHAAMPPHQPTHKPGGPPPPHYLHLAPGVAPPELDRTTPSRAVVVVEADVEMPWRLLVCDWLVHSGCLYVMAWGRECGLWHDCVDECHLAEFGFGDIPDERHAMTTWHEDEPLGDVFRFCQNCASHPHVDLTRTIIMHIAAAPREAELLAAYRAAADD